MKLSRTAWYAVQAMAYIAKQKEIAIGHQVAKTLEIPEGFLLRILVSLSRARLLHSVKGPNGGYRLGRSAKEISLLEVLEAVDGPIMAAMPEEEQSTLAKKLTPIFKRTNELVRNAYAKVKIADLA